jgi:hypothetical protein
MKATGILFLNRTRPTAGLNAGGEFELVLSALHRISARQAELWQVRYIGQRAKEWWDACGAALVPGQPIAVSAKDMRVYGNGRPVIEAIAESVVIAPRSYLDEATA